MDCPHCTETMHPTVVGSVELHICSACSAVFFDAGELRRQLRAGRRLEEEPNTAATTWGKPTEWTCPKCSGTFAVVATLAGRVEVCDGCDGAMLSVDVFHAAPRRGGLPVESEALGEILGGL